VSWRRNRGRGSPQPLLSTHARCSLPPRTPLAAHCSPLAASYLLIAARCSLLAARCSLLAARCSLLAARCSLPTAYHSLHPSQGGRIRRHRGRRRVRRARRACGGADRSFRACAEVRCYFVKFGTPPALLDRLVAVEAFEATNGMNATIKEALTVATSAALPPDARRKVEKGSASLRAQERFVLQMSHR
jgi:hypothetical protein